MWAGRLVGASQSPSPQQAQIPGWGESAVRPYYPSREVTSDGAELGLWDTKRCLLGSDYLGGQGRLPAAGEGALSRELEEQSPAEGPDGVGRLGLASCLPLQPPGSVRPLSS